ncbi:unnamed protein product [Fraxinus pennsylvanica]|uniref:NAD-dependent epimerase/dehydratase domain-containing protein n=1 Tax=Fraxinus pennsylvanica TaxID=56036 RepID=A0AAD1ZWI7_9LAMI|nr:unnamed protein product [Fraxinus pennsylvanica]
MIPLSPPSLAPPVSSTSLLPALLMKSNEILAPAIKGTINVLTAAKELGVRRVVVTSSITAIVASSNWPADVVKNEECWTDEEYCKQNGSQNDQNQFYPQLSSPIGSQSAEGSLSSEMAKREGEAVCVTGGSGYIGSWLVRLLLERGYTVHATVKDIKDEKETKHLEDFEGAKSRLLLFQLDLLNYDSIVTAITGTTGVFHLASPCIIDEVRDPENELLAPAIKGTVNVLTAAKELGVRRVVVTSSVSAIAPSPNWPADVVKNEECWTDEEYCRQKGLWYPLSKTLAEKAAWEFSEEKKLDIVVVNPGTVMGPIIPPALNASMVMILRLLQGCTDVYEDFFIGSVHVKDVALAHILVYENNSATGRHLCVEALSHYGDFAAKVADLFPEYKVPRLPKDTQPGLLRVKDASKKLIDLGLEFIPMEQIIRDAVQSLKSKGFIA